MKKDKKWFVDKWTEERDKSAVHDPMYHFINEFITDVKELDEPEVLSQKWIDENKEARINNLRKRTTDDVVPVDKLENLLVPKQELPVIPKYVADWITKHRDTFDLYPMLKRLEKNSSKLELTYKWYRTNTHEFVSAYLTGEYEVEEEPLYHALIKGHELVSDEGEWSTKYWNLWVSGGSVFPSDRLADYDDFLTTMSKEEWNEWGINDTNADFVKVEENE